MKITQDEIEARALRLGFSFIGFTRADQSPHFHQYREIIARQSLGDLNFLKQPYVIQGRKHPASLLTGAKSVIMLGTKYPPPPPQSKAEKAKPHGTISAYAAVPDYHQVIREKASQLMEQLQQDFLPDVHWRIFIDSGPMLEKDMVFSTGLCSIGKNSLCIHPEHGSYFFICCILTDLELKIDQSSTLQDLCGDCKQCVNACPTGCIINHTIGITRCIAYLTIEHKGIIPRDLRSKIGNLIYGCDVCQSVCPYNKHPGIKYNGFFFNIDPVLSLHLDLNEEIVQTPEIFNKKFGTTPIQRIGYERYIRNIIIVAGNTRDTRCIPALQRLATHPNDLFSIHAIWSLHQFSEKNIKTFLFSLFELDISNQAAIELRTLLEEND